MLSASLHGGDICTARLEIPGETIPAIIGAAGIRTIKVEGDHATPEGLLVLRRVFYRADRIARPQTSLPVEPLAPDDGWCDDSADPAYNRHVRLPYAGRHERLWRDDALYDLIIVLGYNDDPVVPGSGSAIFMHLPQPSGGPTEGCIALPEPVIRRLLAQGLYSITVRRDVA